MPVLGLLDDLLIVPLGIALAIRMVPPGVMADLRARALEQARPVSRSGLAIIVAIWILFAGAALWFFWPATRIDMP